MTPATGLLLSLLSASSPPPARVPVLAELFTSEGCSSCPDADALLRRLDQEQPVVGAEVIALELHVDYWNNLGWADPFSRPEYRARQGRYSAVFGRDGVYTPQLVIDGATQLVGSHGAAVLSAVTAAVQPPQARIALQQAGSSLRIDLASAPEGDEVVLALAESGLASQVTRGENAGRKLEHAPVVRALRRVGTAHGEAHLQEPLELPAGMKPEHGRAVVFLQDPRTLQIHGAAMLQLEGPAKVN
jgi:hypothetical protein